MFPSVLGVKRHLEPRVYLMGHDDVECLLLAADCNAFAAVYGNAVNWWSDTLWPKGTEPKPGAIMVYGSNYGGGYGHVRVVEKVESGKVFYAAANESRRMAFAWINAPKVTTNGFLGYIYNPFVEETAQLEAKIEQLEASLQQAEELLAIQDKALKTAQNKLERIREIL